MDTDRATGGDDERLKRARQGSSGFAARDEEDVPYPSTDGAELPQWPETRVSRPGLNDRSNVFFAAVEMTRMPMILTNPNLPDNPIVFANLAFLDLTGYQEEEIVGRNCRFLQGAHTDREQVAELRQAIAEQKPISVELLNYKRDGTPFWNNVYIAPIYDDAGELLYFFASQLDITRRRLSEKAFRQAQAQKMEAIGQLTAGLAHDFNNLLQVVTSNLEILRLKLSDDDLRRYAESSHDAAERGARLTRQLLAFARKTRLEPKPLDVSALVHGIGEMLEATVGAQIELQVNLRRRLPPVLVDPVHLEMALLNVVINARDAMPTGGTVTIATSVVVRDADGASSGRHVAISVIDEGVGMPAYILERATEPFFTTKGLGKGTGLGLAMVHGFVKQSLGRLEIESEPGHGTTVRMLFPVRDDARLERGGPSPEAASPHEDLRATPETILVVEDNDDVLVIAREHLLGLGYRVMTARNADEALELLDTPENQAIDLLFSDILMPGSMNGLVLAEHVRKRLPDVAVLFTTGYNEELIVAGPNPSSADVLGKPYRCTDLADRVRSALNVRARGIKPHVAMPRAHEGPRHEG